MFHDTLGYYHGLKKMLYIAGALSIITVPLPRCCRRCMETDIYDFKDEPDPSYKAKKKAAAFKAHIA